MIALFTLMAMIVSCSSSPTREVAGSDSFDNKQNQERAPFKRFIKNDNY